MFRRTSRLALAAALCAPWLASGASASAQTYAYPGFAGAPGLVEGGDASVARTADGSVLRLVQDVPSQTGSAFGASAVGLGSFSTEFSFRMTDPGGISDGAGVGGDGLSFVLQAGGSAAGGGTGAAIGYGGTPNSLAVEFDTFRNPGDPSSNHVGIDLNGSTASAVTANVSPNFDDGDLWHAWIDYNGSSLQVRLGEGSTRPLLPTLSYAVRLGTLLGQDSGYVGFEAGTGDAWENVDVTSWEFKEGYAPILSSSVPPSAANPFPVSVGQGSSPAPLPPLAGTLVGGGALVATCALRASRRKRRRD